MKVDFHSHILPGLDDGARTLDDALMLAGAMRSWGFERVYCTPHINALYRNTPEIIRPAFEELKEALEIHGVDLDIRMSAEYRLVPETWHEVLEKDWLMPIEDKYILMELPISKRSEMKDINPLEEFRRIVSMGLTPILPHPERYFYLSHKELLEFVDAGVVIQCNYGSLAGLYGIAARDRARALVDEGIVTMYGTDMHNLKYVDIIGQWFAQGNRIEEL
jgi:tyrosine-protein phosphatase YwqE